MLMGLGVMYGPHNYQKTVSVLIQHLRTAICCIARTSLSGAVTDQDLTCKPQCISLGCMDRLTTSIVGASVPNVGWRLPEVNIGIVCANAPILRPLYLFFHGRLQAQRTTAFTHTSRERAWPSNARRKDSIRLGPSSNWHQTLADPAVEVEMGLPIHPTPPPLRGLLKDKPYFSLGSGQ